MIRNATQLYMGAGIGGGDEGTGSDITIINPKKVVALGYMAIGNGSGKNDPLSGINIKGTDTQLELLYGENADTVSRCEIAKGETYHYLLTDHYASISGMTVSENTASLGGITDGGEVVSGFWRHEDGGWRYYTSDETWVQNSWKRIVHQGQPKWYHFNASGYADTGWFQDRDGVWYYLSPNQDSTCGEMVTGWLRAPKDGKWYYLDRQSGAMHLGWLKDPADGRWYYLEPQNGAMRTGWLAENGKEYYLNPVSAEALPLGALTVNGRTPDGRVAGGDGAVSRS